MKSNSDSISFTPIGIFHSSKKNPYEAPRQGTASATETVGFVELKSGLNFEQALTGLEGFTYLWLVYVFNRHEHWSPMVMPPRGSETKQGVFATRAPYRPNNIGISAVKLEKIEGLKVYISHHDILDGTPILDIKPYLPYSDSFPDANMGWLENIEKEKFQVEFTKDASDQIQFLEAHGVTELKPFLIQQLEFDPTNSKKKRVSQEGNHSILAYRTWRAQFSIDEQVKNIKVANIFSGYSIEDLDESQSHYTDSYLDKALHRKFLKFSSRR